jgi:hypothetical protein
MEIFHGTSCLLLGFGKKEEVEVTRWTNGWLLFKILALKWFIGKGKTSRWINFAATVVSFKVVSQSQSQSTSLSFHINVLS